MGSLFTYHVQMDLSFLAMGYAYCGKRMTSFALTLSVHLHLGCSPISFKQKMQQFLVTHHFRLVASNSICSAKQQAPHSFSGQVKLRKMHLVAFPIFVLSA